MDALTLAGFFLGGFLTCALLSVGAIKLLVDLHRDERAATAAEREQFRSERRELLNRVQHPNLVPTGTERPAPRPPDPRLAERARAWAQVGRVVPGNGDEAMPATDELELP